MVLLLRVKKYEYFFLHTACISPLLNDICSHCMQPHDLISLPPCPCFSHIVKPSSLQVVNTQGSQSERWGTVGGSGETWQVTGGSALGGIYHRRHFDLQGPAESVKQWEKQAQWSLCFFCLCTLRVGVVVAALQSYRGWAVLWDDVETEGWRDRRWRKGCFLFIFVRLWLCFFVTCYSICDATILSFYHLGTNVIH